jgi:hypothetical protein
MLNLSNNEIFWVIVLVLHPFKLHAIGLGNHVGLISLNELSQSFRNLVISSTSFSDYKVKENDSAKQNNDGPESPEKLIVWRFKVI